MPESRGPQSRNTAVMTSKIVKSNCSHTSTSTHSIRLILTFIKRIQSTNSIMLTFLNSPPLISHRPSPLRSSRRPTVFLTSRKSPQATLSDVLIVGANRGLGFDLATLLSGTVDKLITTYHSFCPPTLAAISTVHRIDALDKQTVHTMITNVRPHTIVSCLGGNVQHEEYPDYKGNRNLIDAAVEANVRRFIMISALGAGDSERAMPFQVMDTMRPLLLEKSRAELYLREQSLEWVIIRPGPFEEGEPTGSAVATESISCYGTITRMDVADLLSKIIASDKVARKTLQVVDTKKFLITSPYVRPLEFWETPPFEQFTL